jgi:hypothetical protein
MLGSQSHTEASVFEREIPELPLDQTLEPDWLERREPASKGSGCQSNSVHDTAERAFHFEFHDFEHHDDHSLMKTNYPRAFRAETDSFHTKPLQMMAMMPRKDKSPPSSPNADKPSAMELHPGKAFDWFWHKTT